MDDLDMFQEALSKLGLPPLRQRFKVPSIESAFDDIRPHVVEEAAELHGLMAAGWSYLGKIRIVNDLTEKSIRNHSIRHLWSSGST
ncbi:MAG: hypothetical protein E5V40_05905 [Mesorhizobium sp.]|nr:MAG: hypothetical protein E5V40_05905 [Mesorhizobium sp.]